VRRTRVVLYQRLVNIMVLTAFSLLA